MSCSWQTTSFFSESTSGRAIDAGTGVTSPIHRLDSLGESTLMGRMMRLLRPATAAYRCIICSYESTSGPPMSNQRLTSGGRVAQPTR